ncbi:hypothetical protein ABZX51_007222 [Aspergillus tubingensis]
MDAKIVRTGHLQAYSRDKYLSDLYNSIHTASINTKIAAKLARQFIQAWAEKISDKRSSYSAEVLIRYNLHVHAWPTHLKLDEVDIGLKDTA